MFETIAQYEEKKLKNLAKIEVKDGNVILSKKVFNEEDGSSAYEVIGETTKQLLLDEIASYQAQIDAINSFIIENNL